MKKLLFLALILFLSGVLVSQNRYWVFFTNKNNTSFNPYKYFSEKAIDRRIKHGISLYDSTDFPVSKIYINEVNKIVDSVNVVTRWFNGISVFATKEQLSKVADLNFVKKIQPILVSSYTVNYDTNLSYYDSVLLNQQIDMMQGKKFSEKNITGKGIRIAVFDAGFPGVDNIPVFEHIRKNNRILKTYDFARNKDYVYKHNSHGTMVLSCIAGKIGEKNIGLATDAEFLLARTEINREPFSEEENWLAAAEWADKNGADIITSSLGYTIPRYFQYEMDGKTTFVAKAAKMASDKGILVVNAIGNSGNGNWKVVGTPADVDEVLSVGGVDPATGVHINFSSFGPTADGRLKPEVSASGKAFLASKNGLSINYGTSFATPFVTGFAACVLQSDTSLKNMELKNQIIKSANLYPYYDYAHGYGIPQATYFTDTVKADKITFEASLLNDTILIKFPKLKDSTLNKIRNDFFYHFRYNNGKIAEYKVIYIFKEDIKIPVPEKDKPIIFMAFYKGFVQEIKL